MKILVNSEFHLNHKCQYEALALKLEFNKLFIRICQLVEDYKNQEFPDVYQHLRMIRTVNQNFQNWMMLHVGNLSGIKEFNKIGLPKANSTPFDDKKLENTQNSFFTPLSRARVHRAVRQFHDTLNQLQLPCTSYGSSKQVSFYKKPKFNATRTQLPCRRMNFSKSFVNETPQTQ